MMWLVAISPASLPNPTTSSAARVSLSPLTAGRSPAGTEYVAPVKSVTMEITTWVMGAPQSVDRKVATHAVWRIIERLFVPQ